MYRPPAIDRRLCLAPMMGYTDRHWRALLRLICPDAMLYTEMVTAAALRFGDQQRLLDHDKAESPCALQLGGNDPAQLRDCSRMAEDHGYQEVNLNLGCPSDRVRQGQMGACLMAQPELVAECIHQMSRDLSIPVTVKCRIGIDDHDSYDFFRGFIDTVSQGGCRIFIVHARKALLQGLSPRENRDVPPLRYEYVYRLKQERPELTVILNGGLGNLADIERPLRELDGVMIGRAALDNPMSVAALSARIHSKPPRDRLMVHNLYLEYLQAQLDRGEPMARMARHLLNISRGLPGSRAYRQRLSTNMHRQEFDVTALREAAAATWGQCGAPC